MSITDNPATRDGRWCSWFALAAADTAGGQQPLFSLSLVKVLQKAKLEVPKHFSFAKSPEGPTSPCTPATDMSFKKVLRHSMHNGSRAAFPRLLAAGDVPTQKKAEAARKPTQGLAVSGAGAAACRGPGHALQEHQLLRSARTASAALPSPSQLEPVHALESRNKGRFLVCRVLFAGSVKPVEMGLGMPDVVGNTSAPRAQRVSGRDGPLPSVLGEVAALALSFGRLRVWDQHSHRFPG